MTKQFGNLWLTTWRIDEMTEHERLRVLTAANGWLIHHADEKDRELITGEIHKLIYDGKKGFSIESLVEDHGISIKNNAPENNDFLVERW